MGQTESREGGHPIKTKQKIALLDISSLDKRAFFEKARDTGQLIDASDELYAPNDLGRLGDGRRSGLNNGNGRRRAAADRGECRRSNSDSCAEWHSGLEDHCHAANSVGSTAQSLFVIYIRTECL